MRSLVNTVQLLRRKPRCRLEVTRLMSRRRIQQLREAGASGRSDDVRAGRDADDYNGDDDDEALTNNTALRMSLRHIRSVDDVADHCQLLRSTIKVGLVCLKSR